jgi:hypothetical protein
MKCWPGIPLFSPSIVESCRELGGPIRQCLADVLPGLADRFIRCLSRLTPMDNAANSQNSLTMLWVARQLWLPEGVQ